MAFQDYVCWNESRVFAVMNPDAENVPDEVFLAVHSEHPLTLMDTVIENRAWADAVRRHGDPHVFLNQFLDSNRTDVKAVILGSSGSGKSHFIKWMSVNIPHDPSRYVLTIPKAGMSLRSIVERIIGVLPSEKQGRYREQLEQIGYHAAKPEELRGRLLNRIAEAILADPKRDSTSITEEQAWLLDDLPNIFLDPYLRTFLDRDGGIMDELVDHIFEMKRKGYQRRETVRSFQAPDLPLRVADINQMAKQSRDVLIQLSTDPDLVPVALEIINRNLNRAIPQVLNFTGDQLNELMLEIRRFLGENGKELVLLIEDFARLQGIDGALLQALIVGASPDNGLCGMRWAMAVTRGYYEQMGQTAQTRMDFIVDMDLATGTGEGSLTEDHIVAFAARYLNAARLSGGQLLAWRNQQRDTGQLVPVPNACEACPHSSVCHAVFGSIDHIGLYPFTRNAVLNMARRRDSRFDERFNPRFLIKEVLSQVLGNYHRELGQGQFPPASLLEVMHGSRFSPTVEFELKRDQPELAQRRLTLLGLWSRHPKEPDMLPEGIYRAFSLAPVPPTLLGLKPTPENTGDVPPLPPQPPIRQQRTALDINIEAIQAWGRGGQNLMPERLINPLRELVYSLVESYFDWDAAGLNRIDFARRTEGEYFKARNIYFRRQEVKFQPAALSVTLPIPLNEADSDELLEAAIALEGLLRFNHEKSWNFPGGAGALAALNECLERWAAHLLAQFRRIPDGQGEWDPVPSAVEVLAAGAALAGRPTKAAPSLVDQLNALFEAWPKDAAACQALPWRSLYQPLQEKQDTLVQLVQQWAAGGKGGQAGNFLDPARIVPALRQMCVTWTPNAVPPSEVLARRDGPLGLLDKLHTSVRSDLPKTAQAEWRRRQEWLMLARQNVPQDVTWDQVIQALQTLTREVRGKGLGYRAPLMQALEEELKKSYGLGYDNIVKEIAALGQSPEPVRAIMTLARSEVSLGMVQAERLFTVAKQFLDEVEAEVTGHEAGLGTGTAALKSDQDRIQQGLEQLSKSLDVLGGGKPC